MARRSEILSSLSPKLKGETDWISERINSKKLQFHPLTFSGYKRNFVDGLRDWPKSKRNILSDLITTGFNSLNVDGYWLKLEISAYKLLKHEVAVAFTRALFSFYKLFTKQPNIERVSTINVGNKSIDLAEIYSYSIALGNCLRNALEALGNEKNRKDGTKCCIANNVIWSIKNLIIKYKSCDSLESAYQQISSEIENHKFSKPKVVAIKTCFRALMETYRPSLYGRHYIHIGRHRMDITSAANISEVFKVQLEKLSNSEHMTGKHGHKSRANVGRLHAVLRTIVDVCGSNKAVLNAFERDGLDCLAMNNFLLLKSISSTLRSHEASELKRLYEIYSNRNISKQELSENILSFHNKKSGQTKTIDIRKLQQLGQRFVADVIDLHQSETDLNEHKNYGMETLHTRFSVLMKMAKFLNAGATKKHGLGFLSASKGKYQIELLSKIQAECLNKAVSRRTAEGASACIRWICQVTNQLFINVYRITSNRHAIHAARLGTKDTYSLEEVRELAFYIEKSISQLSVSSKNLLSLHFAKIQIKTCINTASLLTVECDDIRQIDIPTKDKPITVLIQKPRKGYKTDYFNFDPRFPKSAIHDLLYVRDQLTSTVRKKFSSNALSEHLFIYEEAGQLKTLTNTNTVAHIAQFLLNVGCTVKYNSAKLRKTGANEIYRQLAKDISRYKDALKHSYPTFVKHYQRISEAKQKLNLQKATETMDKYFTGKEISSEIKIVTEYSKSTQLTPLGGCTSKTGSKEAVSYKKSHASLDSSAPLRCGDFLACVWCKYYRVVADASHIWQLLSFKMFVLASMGSSVAHFSDASTQKQAIEALNYRVDSIINTIKSINYSAVHEGEALMHTKGMHPDWEFAFPALGLTP